MPLVVRDGNNAAQNLPNAGIDGVFYIVDATIGASATSATDIYQFKGAAGVVARLRRVEAWSNALPSASTSFAGSSSMVKLFRRSTAGTVGTWTQLNTSTTYAASTFALTGTSAITVNVAGNTAFTAGTTQGEIRRGYVLHSNAPASGLNLGIVPLVWLFGVNGNAPCSITGTADYLNVNLNGVTPVAGITFNFEWEEATF